MSAAALDIRPLAGACGGEVFGVDATKPLSNDVSAALKAAWLENQVIVLRDQDLSPAGLVTLARNFGAPNIYPFVKGFDEQPEVIRIVKEPSDDKTFGERWHSDTTYLPNPPIATMLYGVEIPEYGGDTAFASAQLAYERLSPALQEMLSDLKGVNNASVPGGRASGRLKFSNMAITDQDENKLEATHPLIRTHPDTGKKSIYVNGIHTKRVDGWTEAESKPLLDYLFDHITRPEHTCRVQWTKGAVTLWDNRAVQHTAINDYQGLRREAWRVTIEGESPK